MSTCDRSPNNDFAPSLLASEQIVNHLFNNAPAFWKLLKYTNYNDMPYSQDDLTNAEKVALIVREPYDPTNPDSNTMGGVLFQFDISEAFTSAAPQVRIEVGDIEPYSAIQGVIAVNFQIIVPNQQEIFIAPYSASASRSLALAQEITKALNGTFIENFALTSPLFMNKQGQGRTASNTGWFRQRMNENYAGYFGTFGALVFSPVTGGD